MKKTNLTRSLVTLGAIALISMPLAGMKTARADETTQGSSAINNSNGATQTTNQKKKKRRKRKHHAKNASSQTVTGTVAGTTSAAGGETTGTSGVGSASGTGQSAEAENTRIAAYEGSGSAWSGQITLVYQGAPINNLGARLAPNPTGTAPFPTVQLSGQVGINYRLDKTTTLAAGTGVLIYNPFTNPNGTSLADPYIGYNKLVKTGPITNFIQPQFQLWTDNQYYTQDGYIFGLTLNDQSYHVFRNGITVGVNFWIAINAVSSDPKYDPGQQDVWYFGGGPYIEYAINDRWNLRSVLGEQIDRFNSLPGRAMFSEDPYQTLGVGCQIIKAWYIYVYAEASPYSGHFTTSNTGTGFDTVINLF